MPGVFPHVLQLQEVDDFFHDAAVFHFFAARAPIHRACSMKLALIFRFRPVMMLSSTVMPVNSTMFWKVRAIPCSAASLGVHVAALLAWKVMVPSCGV